MIRYQVNGDWFLYDHDTRSWAFYEPGLKLFWHPVLPDEDEEDLALPDDYAEWLPDN